MIYEACHENDEWLELSPGEIDAAVQRGLRMRKYSLEHGHQERGGWIPDEARARYIQCIGEVACSAVARGLGFPPDEIKTETFQGPDLPGNVEVRLISVDRYGLRVYDKDDNDKNVVGVVIPVGQERCGRYRCPGWIKASDAKYGEWSMAPLGRRPMYAVPQKFLLPLSDLRRKINGDGKRLRGYPGQSEPISEGLCRPLTGDA